LDTCASLNLVDPELARRLTPLAKFARINGNTRQPMFSLAGAKLGDIEFENAAEAAQLDLRDLARATGYPIRGVLGMAFLSNRVVRLGFEKGEMSFLDSSPNKFGVRFDLQRDGRGLPMVSLRDPLNSDSLFYVDTGMIGPSIAISSFDIRRCLKRGLFIETSHDALVATADGIETARVGWLRGMRVGGLQFDWLRAMESPERMLGLNFLAKHDVIFDFANNRMFLKPRRSAGERDTKDTSGLQLAREDAVTSVVGVKADSPAEAVGISVGDRLIAIDGEESSAIRLYHIASLLARENRRVRLKIASGSETREVVLPLGSHNLDADK
jgi:hypothetical protein